MQGVQPGFAMCRDGMPADGGALQSRAARGSGWGLAWSWGVIEIKPAVFATRIVVCFGVVVARSHGCFWGQAMLMDGLFSLIR